MPTPPSLLRVSVSAFFYIPGPQLMPEEWPCRNSDESSFKADSPAVFYWGWLLCFYPKKVSVTVCFLTKVCLHSRAWESNDKDTGEGIDPSTLPPGVLHQGLSEMCFENCSIFAMLSVYFPSPYCRWLKWVLG